MNAGKRHGIRLSDLNELDFGRLANGPLPLRLLVAALLAVAVAAGGWWLGWRDQADQLSRIQSQERELKSRFELRQQQAANLDAYQQQLDRMHESFEAMLRQLPSRAEVARLLVDISQSGTGAGLEFELFRPEREIRQEFYVELPVTIRVRGSFHQFGNFVSTLANLSRIVTVHDVHIRPAGELLTMELSARTYWYLDGGEQR